MRPPWWFCCGWWSPWCLLDYIVYEWLWFHVETDHWFDRRHMGAHEKYLRRTHPEYFDPC